MKKSNKRNSLLEELQGTTEEIIKQVKRLLKKGNARRLIIENKKGKVLFQTQLTAGLAGSALIVFISPIIAAISFFGAVLSDIKVIVEKYPQEEFTEDEYEVQAEVIEIEDEDDNKGKKKEDQSNKTVGNN